MSYTIHNIISVYKSPVRNFANKCNYLDVIGLVQLSYGFVKLKHNKDVFAQVTGLGASILRRWYRRRPSWELQIICLCCCFAKPIRRIAIKRVVSFNHPAPNEMFHWCFDVCRCECVLRAVRIMCTFKCLLFVRSSAFCVEEM